MTDDHVSKGYWTLIAVVLLATLLSLVFVYFKLISIEERLIQDREDIDENQKAIGELVKFNKEFGNQVRDVLDTVLIIQETQGDMLDDLTNIGVDG